MEYFAEITEGTVQRVIVVDTGETYPESEATGQALIASWGIEGEWLQTSLPQPPLSRNGAFRGRYAGKGFTYDTDLDEFIAPNDPAATGLAEEEIEVAE